MTNTAIVKQKSVQDFEALVTAGVPWSEQIMSADELMRPIVIAQAFASLRPLITPECLAAIKQLENTPLGFRTDRPDGYDDQTLIEIALVVISERSSFAGNRFNIIASNYYETKEAWTAKLRQLQAYQVDKNVGSAEGVSHGEKNAKGSANWSAKFAASASCVINGQRYEVRSVNENNIDSRIEVSGFGRSIADVIDQMKGKVEARILHRLYDYVKDVQHATQPTSQVIEVTTPAPAIEHNEAAQLADAVWQGKLDRAQKRIKDDFQRQVYSELWNEIALAKSVEELRKLWQTCSEQTEVLGKNNVGELQEWCKHRSEGIQHAEA